MMPTLTATTSLSIIRDLDEALASLRDAQAKPQATTIYSLARADMHLGFARSALLRAVVQDVEAEVVRGEEVAGV